MGHRVPHPADLFAPGRRHLVVLAHQDDELPFAGLLQRLRPDLRVVWLTNGDGLAPRAKADPAQYAAARRRESVAAMDILGVGEDRLCFLDHSEIALYAHLAAMSRDRTGARGVPAELLACAEEVWEETRAFEPDVVWTLAYQGGHPEHDLAHLCAARAVRRLDATRPRATPLYELPAYELTFLVPLRFGPWRRGEEHAIALGDRARELKRRMLEAYPTQDEIIANFRRLIGLYGRLSALRNRPFDFERYGATEVFGPVPPSRDYGRSSHGWWRLDYLFDDFEGIPIRFDRTLPRIARALEL